MYQVDQLRLSTDLSPATLIELSTAFYRRVDADPDPVFRGLFPPDLQDAIRNQYEFLIQRFGGPQLYTQRKGFPALRSRHAPFKITPTLAERWLAHMRAAMAEVGLAGEIACALDEYFADTAKFLVNTDERGGGGS